VDPAVGLALSAVAPAPLRFLAAEMLGHPPSKEDLPGVRKELLPRVRKLLPALDDVVVDELLARACHAPPPEREEGERTHPVDAAVAAAVLVGVALRVTGREPDDLATVAEELRQAEEREEKERRG
jgi:hypothetical protein